MFIYLQFDLNWWHPQKMKARLRLLGLIKYHPRPFYRRPYRVLLTGPVGDSQSELLQWCRRNIRSMTKMKKDQTLCATKAERCCHVTGSELRLFEKEMGKFLQGRLKEPERWKETLRSLSARGLTECSIVIREKAFPLEDVF